MVLNDMGSKEKTSSFLKPASNGYLTNYNICHVCFKFGVPPRWRLGGTPTCTIQENDLLRYALQLGNKSFKRAFILKSLWIFLTVQLERAQVEINAGQVDSTSIFSLQIGSAVNPVCDGCKQSVILTQVKNPFVVC